MQKKKDTLKSPMPRGYQKSTDIRSHHTHGRSCFQGQSEHSIETGSAHTGGGIPSWLRFKTHAMSVVVFAVSHVGEHFWMLVDPGIEQAHPGHPVLQASGVQAGDESGEHRARCRSASDARHVLDAWEHLLGHAVHVLL